uniref:Uncharacterized protein n=1 Tax=Bicosoecida sp. CB-2014 TaxID=1486930 RepID=A0A7S1C211_9STRA|mmetsp:Transcript_10762/g.37496  ORF Transcript_10762/g.37496 Transcript_10762/m.37496 type:complete len:141 (-) Transcript_10762:146-568(-)
MAEARNLLGERGGRRPADMEDQSDCTVRVVVCIYTAKYWCTFLCLVAVGVVLFVTLDTGGGAGGDGPDPYADCRLASACAGFHDNDACVDALCWAGTSCEWVNGTAGECPGGNSTLCCVPAPPTPPPLLRGDAPPHQRRW